jgi:hypothetical protein
MVAVSGEIERPDPVVVVVGVKDLQPVPEEIPPVWQGRWIMRGLLASNCG